MMLQESTFSQILHVRGGGADKRINTIKCFTTVRQI